MRMKKMLALGAAGVAIAWGSAASAVTYVKYTVSIREAVEQVQFSGPVRTFGQLEVFDIYADSVNGFNYLTLVNGLPIVWDISSTGLSVRYTQGAGPQTTRFSVSATGSGQVRDGFYDFSTITGGNYTFEDNTPSAAQSRFGTFVGISTAFSNVSFVPAPRVDVTTYVPEPSTWLMMIGGFGLIGTMLRRRAQVRLPAL